MRVFLAGATGFIGSRVLERLLEQKHEVVALVRDPRKVAARNGLRVVKGDIAFPLTYRGQMLGCAAAINCVGLLRQRWDRPKVRYERVVVRGTGAWANEAREAGVKHLVLVSANGAAPDGTKYQRSKWAAEQAVRNSGLRWTILRPSFVIGPGGFLAQMRSLMRLRVLPIFGRRDYFASPIALDDVVAAIVASLTTAKARDQVLHLGGPDDLPYREMLQTIRAKAGIRCALPRLPLSLGYVTTACLGWLPFFPATLENLRMLAQGNVVPEREWEKLFQIRATRFEDAVDRALKTLGSP